MSSPLPPTARRQSERILNSLACKELLTFHKQDLHMKLGKNFAKNTYGIIENKAKNCTGNHSTVGSHILNINYIVRIVVNQDNALLLLVYKHIAKRCSQLTKVLLSRDCRNELTKKTWHYQATNRQRHAPTGQRQSPR